MSGTKIEGLTELLENLKEEVESWQLDGADATPESTEESTLIRRGLYLTAMDVLYADMRRQPGQTSYDAYSLLPDRILLPEEEFNRMRHHLEPFVKWFRSLLLAHATRSTADANASEDELICALLEDPALDLTIMAGGLKNF
ncbi:MAG: hypothetical protein HY075_04705 [Deltaproteobacteria bacterium]|nr:hypothetical protein [Deltaproteobacteria bacterium]